MISEKGAKLPCRACVDDAGYDFFLPEAITLNKGCRVLVDTGIRFEEGDIPSGYFMLLAPKSSSGSNYGLALANTVGVIDAGYRDTVKAKLWMNDPSMEHLILEKGQKFMQGILVPFGVMGCEVPPTEERQGGFGSTGQF